MERVGPLDRLLARRFAKLTDPAFEVRLEFLGPLVFGDRREHLAQRRQLVLIADRFAIALLGLLVIRCQIGRHDSPRHARMHEDHCTQHRNVQGIALQTTP